MSPRPAPSADTWRAAVQAARIASTTKLVCYTVAQNLFQVTCSVPVGKLATDASLSRSSVKSHLRRAEKAGLLRVEGKRGTRLDVVVQLPADLVVGIDPATAEAVAEIPIVIPANDPRWHAWLTWRLQSGESARHISSVQRAGLPLLQSAPWPPPSPEVDTTTGLGLVLIPFGTPEFSAWLAHYRRTGRAMMAQAADVGRRTLREHDRWPPVLPVLAEAPIAEEVAGG